MELRAIAPDDLPLYEAIHCDARMMEHLGGPLPADGLARKLREDAEATQADECWVLAIVPDEGGAPAGTVSIWDRDLDGDRITEIGWMVLPAFQRRGLGSRAVRRTLDLARSRGRWRRVHAFPPVTNDPSNLMCRRMGFSRVGTREYDFRGRLLHCHHWTLDLAVDGPEAAHS